MGWLRRMLARPADPLKAEMAAARSEHNAALRQSAESSKHADRVIAERQRIDAMMWEADVSMFRERMERGEHGK